jgi:Pin2-interacting protein X1
MQALGWSDKSGIGGSGMSGNPNHISVVRKMDSQGIGMARVRKEGSDMAAGAGQAGASFEEVLKRLASAGTSMPVQEVVVEEIKVEKPVALRNKLA